MYDIRGRLVRSKTGQLAPHQRFVKWDAGPEATGVYVLQVVGDSWQEARKICVVK
jgi:hypothetical protein